MDVLFTFDVEVDSRRDVAQLANELLTAVAHTVTSKGRKGRINHSTFIPDDGNPLSGGHYFGDRPALRSVQ